MNPTVKYIEGDGPLPSIAIIATRIPYIAYDVRSNSEVFGPLSIYLRELPPGSDLSSFEHTFILNGKIFGFQLVAERQ